MRGEKKQKQEETNENRKSQQFVFDEAEEKYIGKHTGVYHGRLNPKKKNFDGFPRFSQYLSLSENDDTSLAKDNSRDSVSQISIGPSEPLQQKEGSKRLSEVNKTVVSEQLNRSSRNPEYSLPGFGENVISSVKKRSSSIRPSEVKNIKQILMGLDGSDEFEYNDFDYSSSGVDKNENRKDVEIKKNVADDEESNKILKNVVAGNKNKRKSRVSFKETVLVNEFGSESKIQSENGVKPKEMGIGRMSTRFKSLQQPQQDSNTNKVAKVNNHSIFVAEEESRDSQERREQELNYFNQHNRDSDENYEYFEDRQLVEPKYELKKPEENLWKLNKRQEKAKKQLRLVDDSVSQERGISNEKKEIEMKKKSSKQVKKKESKGKQVKENQSKKLKNRKKQQISEEQSKSEEYSRSQSNSGSQRYPKRVRVKPVQFWQNEKVHYKAGKAIGIERATLNLKELLQTDQGDIQHKFNINLHNNEIEIELTLPPKKDFISRGFRSPYKSLLISISEKSLHIKNVKVYFEDGIRTEEIKEDSVIEVVEARQFEIQNKSNTSIILQMRLT